MANADIFISYSRKDYELVAKLVYLLEWYGYDVWWDINSLRSGEDFSQAIQQAINDVKCVIVIWSKDSVQSKWVRSEASIAENSNKLLPVVVDSRIMTSIPAPSNLLHSESLGSWSGDPQDRCFQKMLEAVERFCPQSSKQAFIPKTVDARATSSPPPAPNVFGKSWWFLVGLLVGGALVYGYFEVQGSAQGASNEDKIKGQSTVEIKHPDKAFAPGAGRFIGNSDGTVTDTQTSLLWKTCSEGQIFDTNNSFVCPGLTETYNWKEANEKFIGNTQFAGYSDWRLPNLDELKSLVWCSNGVTTENVIRGCDDKGGQLGKYQSPTIYQKYFPNTKPSYYISSTITTSKGKSNYWTMIFSDGGIYRPYDPEEVRGSIRLVRKIKDMKPISNNKKEEELSKKDGITIFNQSFEMGSSGWRGYSYDRTDYVTEVVNDNSRSGSNSFHIKSKAEKPKEAYVMKEIDKKENLEAIKGRKIKVSTYIKAKDVSGHITFYVNFFSEKEKKRWILSTTKDIRQDKSNWLEYSLHLRVPESALFYSVYAKLNGKGEMWIDDFGMKLLDAAAETQELKELKEFPYGIQG